MFRHVPSAMASAPAASLSETSSLGMGLFLGFGLWRRLVFDSLAIFGQTLPSPPNPSLCVASFLEGLFSGQSG